MQSTLLKDYYNYFLAKEVHLNHVSFCLSDCLSVPKYIFFPRTTLYVPSLTPNHTLSSNCKHFALYLPFFQFRRQSSRSHFKRTWPKVCARG